MAQNAVQFIKSLRDRSRDGEVIPTEQRNECLTKLEELRFCLYNNSAKKLYSRLYLYATIIVSKIFMEYSDEDPTLESGTRQGTQRMDAGFLIERAIMDFYRMVQIPSAFSDSVLNFRSTSGPQFESDSIQRIYEQLLVVLISRRCDNQPPHSNHAWIDIELLTQIGLLVPCIWLNQPTLDRGSQERAVKWLEILIRLFINQKNASVQVFACAPMFLLAMIQVVRARDSDFECATQYFDHIELLLERAGSSATYPPALLYWYGVVLHTMGDYRSSKRALKRSIQNNYEPIESLTMFSLVSLHLEEYFDAADALQRALELNFEHLTSIYNYAIVLELLSDNKAKQKMLGHFWEATLVAEGKPKSILKGSVHENHFQESLKSETAKTANRAFDSHPLFPDSIIDTVFFPHQERAMDIQNFLWESGCTAMENGSWEDAKGFLDKLLDTHILLSGHHDDRVKQQLRVYVYVLLQSGHPSMAIDICHTVLEQLSNDDSIGTYSMEQTILWFQMYLADALLCLEHVKECNDHLKTTVDPMLKRLLAAKDYSQDKDSSEFHDKFLVWRIELMNNFAITSVCMGDLNLAISSLQDALLFAKTTKMEMDSILIHVQYNLVLLLWRAGQKEAACLVWFDARGWDPLRVGYNEDTWNDYKKNFLIEVNECATAEATIRGTTGSDHAPANSDDEQHINVAPQLQVLELDAMILEHWMSIGAAASVSNALHYVDVMKPSEELLVNKQGNNTVRDAKTFVFS